MLCNINSSALIYAIATPEHKPTIVSVWNTIVTQLNLEYGLSLSDCLVSSQHNYNGEFRLIGAKWVIKVGDSEVGVLFYKEGKFSIESYINSENKEALTFTVEDLLNNCDKTQSTAAYR